MRVCTKGKILFTCSVLLILYNCSALSERPLQSKDGKYYFISLKDFTQQEVKGIGFTLAEDMDVSVDAVGGGSKNVWSDLFDDSKGASSMYAGAWIINADTRALVWEMTMRNTNGKDTHREFNGTLSMKKGSYEVYFSAYGFVRSSTFNYSSINIDRRKTQNTGSRPKWFTWFGGEKSMVDEFMEYAKDSWYVTLSAADDRKAAVQIFNAPKKFSNIVFSGTGLGDNAFLKKRITLTQDVPIKIYAIGEGRGRNSVFDYGWLTNEETRERVWEMTSKNTVYAGGSEKNIEFNGTVLLKKGNYELSFVTDDSHSRDDWNATPPYDPFNYGITLSVENESNIKDVRISDYSNEGKNIIIRLTKVRNDEDVSAGFSLKADSKIRIYALGEGNASNRELADYGWITNAKTHKRVWTMEYTTTRHAGGASKNRMVDEIISLPKGDYIVNYQTDDSHAYGDWNSDAPYDPDSWGITLYGAGDNFSMNNVATFNVENEANIVAQLIKVRDDKNVQQPFSLSVAQKVRIYALGEADGDREMADYGWIEDAKTGKTIWEMTYGMTERAGGARKNRLVDRTLYLDKGEYILHYRTDDSHAYGDWNDDPPEDRIHWGITIYKE